MISAAAAWGCAGDRDSPRIQVEIPCYAPPPSWRKSAEKGERGAGGHLCRKEEDKSNEGHYNRNDGA